MQAKDHLPTGALEELVKPSVAFLQSRLFPSGNLPSSEVSSTGDKLVHWCHGAPGAAIMFAMAYKVISPPWFDLYFLVLFVCCWILIMTIRNKIDISVKIDINIIRCAKSYHYIGMSWIESEPCTIVLWEQPSRPQMLVCTRCMYV
jgi:hypothetical protein